MSTCRSCGAEIVWARTAAGKRMPVTSAQRPDGNLILVGARRGHRPRGYPNLGVPTIMALPYDPAKHARLGRHVSHFADCPNADTHRRSR
mgnify:CR=1 FL=1